MLCKRAVLALWASVCWIGGAEAHSKHLHPRILPLVAFPSQRTSPYTITVDADPDHALNRFSPSAAFGVGVDGVPSRAVPEIYTHDNVQQMLGAGLGTVSYRLYTELSVQDWHWNPAGRFSGGTSGY